MVDGAVRLLLAEDDENDAIFLTRAFRKAGFRYPLEIVRDGVEAIERLARRDVSHALLDLKMPRRSGLEVLEWLAGQGGLGVRAAVLSSSKVDRDVRRAYELGAEFYLVKPASTGDLLAVSRELERWLRREGPPVLPSDVLLPRPV